MDPPRVAFSKVANVTLTFWLIKVAAATLGETDASTTFGTTMADFADRSLGIGYVGGSSLLLACLVAVLGLWYWSQGTLSVGTVATPKV